jgi:epoxide hydrolase-like predicted phosphatase
MRAQAYSDRCGRRAPARGGAAQECAAVPGDRRHEGLLVDYGGVLTTNIWESFRSFCATEGLDPEAVKETFRRDGPGLGLLRSLEKGELEDAEFERRFGELLGVSPDDLISRLFAGLGPDLEMVAIVEQARASGVPTGLISNSWGTGIYERAPLHIFDATVISGDVGLHKPQPEIYRLGAERIGVAPELCVFVDDLRENVEGAEAVGMTALLHREPAATTAALRELFALPIV